MDESQLPSNTPGPCFACYGARPGPLMVMRAWWTMDLKGLDELLDLLPSLVFVVESAVSYMLVGAVLHPWRGDSPAVLKSQGTGEQFHVPGIRLVPEALGGHSKNPVKDLDLFGVVSLDAQPPAQLNVERVLHCLHIWGGGPGRCRYRER